MPEQPTSISNPLDAGQSLGPYEILGRLGRGGMGEVYLARDTRLGRRVALKVLPESFAGDAERLARFRREARITSALEHPNILRVYDVGQSGSLHYIVAEYVDGQPLHRRLRAGPLPLREAVDIASAVASALGAAHAAGVVHRDVKPANIMIRRDGSVKVLDFGIAKRIVLDGLDTPTGDQDTFPTHPGLMLGTVRYASPEQAQGLEVDGRTDVWSLGVLLYEMLAGVRPFEGATHYHVVFNVLEREPEPLGQLRAGIPPELEWVVARALAKAPDARYRGADEIYADLQRLAARLLPDGDIQPTEPTQPGETAEPNTGDTRALAATNSAALRSTAIAEPAPNNVPIPLTSFVGRETQIRDVVQKLGDSRLVTLTGPGGIGKTRLALEVGRRAIVGDSGAVWFVELAALTDPAFVPTAVATTLEVEIEPGTEPTRALAEWLGTGRSCLLLDNCEHLVDACARLVDALLGACPGLRVLATSREPLGVAGEAVWPLPSLTFPEESEPPSPPMVADYEATRLFVERARLARPEFTATQENVLAIARVCRRLDGIPLAIELAAARVKVLSVEQISAKLDDRFRLLKGGSRSAPPRQQTLRAAIDWGHDLLSERERTLLRRLSVFVGGFTLPAAEAVAGPDHSQDDGDEDSVEVLDLLARLVDTSLVVAEVCEAASVRYRMYETIAEYASEKLRASGEETLLRARHRDWFLQLAEEAEPQLTGPQQAEWLALLEREHDNLNVALRWSVEEATDHDAGLRMCSALGRFWSMHAHLSEGRSWLARVLGADSDPANPKRPRVLLWAAQLARLQGDMEEARARLDESLALARALGDTLGSAAASLELFSVAYNCGDVDGAEGFATEALRLFRELGERRGAALALSHLGNVASERADYDRAASCYEQALALLREVGDRRSMSTQLNNLGRIAGLRGEYERGIALIGEGLAIVRDLGDKTAVGFFLHALGIVAAQSGEYDLARRYYSESLLAYKELDTGRYIAGLLESISTVDVALGDMSRAVRLIGAAARLREMVGLPLSSSDAIEVDADLDAAGRALAPDELERELEQGRAMTLDEAIAYALPD